MQKRIPVIGLVFLLLFSSVVPISIGYNVNISDIKEQSSNRGNTLYVGGTGPNNYTRIQDAVDNASDGDTVFVYNGTYHEHVIIRNLIYLIGENKNNTIIDADDWINVLEILVGGTISGITCQDSGAEGAGIVCYSNCNIIDNIIKLSYNGIDADGKNINISKNLIFNNTANGIMFTGNSKNCNASYNSIYNNGYIGVAIETIGESYIKIFMNNIYNNTHGILLAGKGNNEIFLNNFYDKIETTIVILESNYDKIFSNNFFGKTKIVVLQTLYDSWHGNYWGRARIIPKIILGWKFIEKNIAKPGFPPNIIVIPIIVLRYDLTPAFKPYDIGV